MADVDDVIRMALRQSLNGQDDQVNVWHFAIGAMPTPATDAAIMQDLASIAGLFFNEIASFISTQVTAVDVAMYNFTDDEPMGVLPFGAGYTGGTSGGEMLPPNDTAMCLLPTAVKRTIGRVYLPTMSEGAQANGQWVSGVHTAVDGALSFLLGPVAGDVFGGTYRYGVLKRSDGILYFPTSGRLAPNVAVQRRRKRGRGS